MNITIITTVNVQVHKYRYIENVYVRHFPTFDLYSIISLDIIKVNVLSIISNLI